MGGERWEERANTNFQIATRINVQLIEKRSQDLPLSHWLMNETGTDIWFIVKCMLTDWTTPCYQKDREREKKTKLMPRNIMCNSISQVRNEANITSSGNETRSLCIAPPQGDVGEQNMSKCEKCI